MNCQNCGAPVDGQSFCPQCGTAVQQQVPGAPLQGDYTKILVFGILGLALGAGTGIVGLIFSIIALKQANAYIAAYGNVSTQVNTGRRLAIAGLIVSIIVIVFWVLFITLMVIASVNGRVSYSYSAYY